MTQVTKIPSVFSDFWNVDSFYNDRFFKPSWWGKDHLFEPAMNIKDNDNEYILELAIPGFKKEEIEINIQDGILTVY